MPTLIEPVLILAVLFGAILLGISSCSHSAEEERRQEMTILLRQDGYCAAIQEHGLPTPEQCQEAVSKTRHIRLMQEFNIR